MPLHLLLEISRTPLKKKGENNGNLYWNRSSNRDSRGNRLHLGIDLKSLLMGALGGKLAADNNPAVVVVPQAPTDENDQ